MLLKQLSLCTNITHAECDSYQLQLKKKKKKKKHIIKTGDDKQNDFRHILEILSVNAHGLKNAEGAFSLHINVSFWFVCVGKDTGFCVYTSFLLLAPNLTLHSSSKQRLYSAGTGLLIKSVD